jgi:hypothetical protein
MFKSLFGKYGQTYSFQGHVTTFHVILIFRFGMEPVSFHFVALFPSTVDFDFNWFALIVMRKFTVSTASVKLLHVSMQCGRVLRRYTALE